MSNYGPPGGSPHGDRQEPWSAGPDQDPFEVPSDPWAEAEPGRDRHPDPDRWHSGQGSGHQDWNTDREAWHGGPDQPPASQESWPTGQDQWPGGQQGHWSAGEEQWPAGQDQWSGQDRWGGQPASTPPDGTGSPVGRPDGDATERHGLLAIGEPGRPGLDPDRAFTDSQPLKPSRTGPIVILTILALLVLGSGGLAIYLVGREDPGSGPTAGSAPTDQPGGTPAVPLGSTAGPTQDTAPGQPTTAPQPSSDARFVAVGQCVVNEGTVEKPQLAITACEPGALEVLQRFDGATTGEEDAKSKCASVAGYTTWYFFDSPFDALDYVLCLKLR
ncbi:hypothetical protein O7627_36560 [Solwaraspora sp. WMMD1047]|uniref:LppU/SCO3897 family protein n=1 Tax=Solwaraspora sp. WMMD1047 TaxID=3016102 RepID=UPI002416B355|nr:hypothetical protein [Solwaraspora sp. WMMD1047]MDG4834782.1 hypothetical protein [Solwaraspora sp. WMMD1047]